MHVLGPAETEQNSSAAVLHPWVHLRDLEALQI